MVVLPRYEQTTEPPTQKPIKWAFEATKTLFAVISQLEHNRKKGANIMSIIENNKQQTNNSQRNAYQLTINNPLEYGFDHLTIKKTLVENFTTLRYFCMADEIGKEGTPHTHLYVYFNSRVRFSTVKKNFPSAHIEPAHGNIESNISYIKKTGKWEGTDKAETRVDGTFEEWGTVPVQKGTRADMEELYELIKAGYSNAEILAMNNDFILNIDKLDRVRTELLIDKFKNTRRTDLKVIYISGATGTGKTRGILDKHGDGNVYRVSDYEHPFDGYSCQNILAFDEFRSQLRLSDMLNYCDIYPIQLPARYANKFACYETVYIISNWSLEDQYKEVQKDNPESWKAFLRRIHEVTIYKEDGTLTHYDSVEAYLKRKEKFHTIEPDEECPFAEQETLFPKEGAKHDE